MQPADVYLYERLKNGPAILLLGQDYLRLESGTDPFLSEVLRKYGKAGGQTTGYKQLLGGTAAAAPESALAWMQERCQLLSVPEWLNVVASFAWNSVYTSAIDVIWMRAFRLGWRVLQPILDDKYNPIDPRNRLRLHATFLFGSVSRTDDHERPPLSRNEWLRRRLVATTLSRRLQDLVTPRGTLVLEGYAGRNDWFSPEDLFAIIDEFDVDQAHMFSVEDEVRYDADLETLVAAGKLVLHEEGLGAFLLRGQQAGHIHLGQPRDEEEHGRRILLGGNYVSVPAEIWTRTSGSATILDESVMLPPRKVSADERYYRFRSFLSESSGRPEWSGYHEGFAFKRTFEHRLRRKVDERLASPKQRDKPVILHGQTGTGKTIALGALAFEICRQGRYPVLFIERRSLRPAYTDIDAFCKWAEDRGAPACLIVWDGMLDIEVYYGLLRYLQSLGRKIVVVGSAYRNPTRKAEEFVLAPAHLSETEIREFISFLNTFDPSLGLSIRREVEQDSGHFDDAFLVALYRLLPQTRAQIVAGVVREAGFAESVILHSAQGNAEPYFATALAYELWRVGLVPNPNAVDVDATHHVGDELLSTLTELLSLVMVPGQFGHDVPLELLLRTIGYEHSSQLMSGLSTVDLLRWREDGLGNISVGSRHPLEAGLFVKSRLGGAHTEVAVAEKLLVEIRNATELFGSIELEFAVDLVRSLGPNGHRKDYFAPHFLQLATALKRLREERSVEQPRLMLQEATLLRDIVIRQQGTHAQQSPRANDLLNWAEETLRRALDVLGEDRKNHPLRSALLVQLAAVQGTRTKELLTDTRSDTRNVLNAFRAVKEFTTQARTFDPENFYPLDVLAWTTLDMLNSDVLDAQGQIEAVADLLYAYDMADIDYFDADQQNRFNMRQMEIAQVTNKPDLAEKAFQAIRDRGSAAGYFLQASMIAGAIPRDNELGDLERRKCAQAVTYLESHRGEFGTDNRCLYLLLRLWWGARTGKPMFFGERQTLPFDWSDWQYCLDLLTQLTSTSGSSATPPLRFLYALTEFHLGDAERAFSIFNELSHEPEYILGRRRILRSYIASTTTGAPRVYNGTVKWVNNEGTRGEVYVEELRRQIPFFPNDFYRRDINKGDILPPFHVAFNFIGPLADPQGNFRSQQG